MGLPRPPLPALPLVVIVRRASTAHAQLVYSCSLIHGRCMRRWTDTDRRLRTDERLLCGNAVIELHPAPARSLIAFSLTIDAAQHGNGDGPVGTRADAPAQGVAVEFVVADYRCVIAVWVSATVDVKS